MPPIYCLTHAEHELPGTIEKWADRRDYPFHIVPVFSGSALPATNPGDCVVVMGGPMNVYEEDMYPWLINEKTFLTRCIDMGNRMLGICLGAQLLAERLGAPVFKNSQIEIGWHPIRWSKDIFKYALFDAFPPESIVFHWHGDMFGIPQDAIQLAASTACQNQGFLWNDQVLGLQFHPEMTFDLLKMMIAGNHEDLNHSGHFIQSADEMIQNGKKYTASSKMVDILLDRFLKTNVDV